MLATRNRLQVHETPHSIEVCPKKQQLQVHETAARCRHACMKAPSLPRVQLAAKRKLQAWMFALRNNSWKRYEGAVPA